MTRQQLVEAVSRSGQWSRKDTEGVVASLLEEMAKSLQAGERIELRGFGSFQVKEKKARQGRNPKTGTRVEVPAKKIPYFKPSKELKDVVNVPHQSSHSETSPDRQVR